MKVAIYARVSTDKQDNANQLEQLREFASKQHWEIVTECTDTASGSGRRTRPQFDAVMLAASQRKFDLLLFWALDRLSREASSRRWAILNSCAHGAAAGAATRRPFSILATK
jgi:DNA invertase Pin-like site-specific DNA recombinase